MVNRLCENVAEVATVYKWKCINEKNKIKEPIEFRGCLLQCRIYFVSPFGM
jgi:hypothetical protein